MYNIIIQNNITEEQFDLLDLFHQYEYDLTDFAAEQYEKLTESQLEELGDNDLFEDDVFTVISVYCDDFYTTIDEQSVMKNYSLETLQDIFSDYEYSIEDNTEYKEQLACYLTDNYSENWHGFIECVYNKDCYTYSTYGADDLEDLAEMFITDGLCGNDVAEFYDNHPNWIDLSEIASDLAMDGYRECEYMYGMCFRCQ